MKKVENRDNINLLYKDNWFKKSENRSFLFRIYSLIGINSNDLNKVSCDLYNVLQDYDAGISLAFGEYENKQFSIFINSIFSDLNGLPVYKMLKVTKPLPSGLYSFVTTYVENNNLIEAEQRLNRSEAMLSLLFGKNFVYSKISETLYNLEDQNETAYTPTVQIPHRCQGPKICQKNRNQAQLFFKQKKTTSEELLNRLNLALDFIYDAHHCSPEINESISFVMYRSAWEVLIKKNSFSHAYKKLMTCYEVEQLKSFHFEYIWRLRDKIIHNGKKIVFSYEDEGYAQAITRDFVDIMLGLECNKNIEQYISDYNYDPLSFGKSVKRTLNVHCDEEH